MPNLLPERPAYLITGGAGSFGRALVKALLERPIRPARVVVYSRDELKHLRLRRQFPQSQFPELEFVVGDVRDLAALQRASRGMDVLVHAAALKHVNVAEANPLECVKTNILGTQNAIDAAQNNAVPILIAVSSDKAAAPAGAYGASKLMAERMVVEAHAAYSENRLKTRVSVLRWGNVLGSEGSVVPLFLEQRGKGELTLTDPGMTRFSIRPEQCVELFFKALNEGRGGEIFTPKSPSFRLADLAQAIAPACTHKVTGARPGEKLFEDLVTETEVLSAVEQPDCFILLPNRTAEEVTAYAKLTGSQLPKRRHGYTSANNDSWLSVDDLRAQIRSVVDPGFVVPEVTPKPAGGRQAAGQA